MGYELTGHQPLADEVKRILTEQIDQALNLAHAKYETEPAVAVHRLRKQFRRIRAIMRLVRPALGNAVWKPANVAVRDLGRRLSPARDATVMLQTLDRLAGHDLETAAALREVLAGSSGEADLPPLAEVAGVLEQARKVVAAWPLEGNSWALVGVGLEATYQAGRRARQDFRREPGTEALHDWRKRAKELRHQLEMLAPVQPKPLGELVEGLRQFCDLLGDEHDLSVLREALQGLPGGKALIREIDAQRRDLQRKARRLGRRLFGDGARVFAGRVQGWWKGWSRKAKH